MRRFKTSLLKQEPWTLVENSVLGMSLKEIQAKLKILELQGIAEGNKR